MEAVFSGKFVYAQILLLVVKIGKPSVIALLLQLDLLQMWAGYRKSGLHLRDRFGCVFQKSAACRFMPLTGRRQAVRSRAFRWIRRKCFQAAPLIRRMAARSVGNICNQRLLSSIIHRSQTEHRPPLACSLSVVDDFRPAGFCHLRSQAQLGHELFDNAVFITLAENDRFDLHAAVAFVKAAFNRPELEFVGV